jgi:hypothetical protein
MNAFQSNKKYTRIYSHLQSKRIWNENDTQRREHCLALIIEKNKMQKSLFTNIFFFVHTSFDYFNSILDNTYKERVDKLLHDCTRFSLFGIFGVAQFTQSSQWLVLMQEFQLLVVNGTSSLAKVLNV